MNEFSVVEFYDDDTHAYVERGLDARDAVALAWVSTRIADLEDSNIVRVIITDGGDYTTFQWERGKGVTFPPATGSG
jgi:hypothetical protein